MRARIILLVRVLVGGGLIAAILASVNLSAVLSTLRSVEPSWLLAVCTVALSFRVLKAYKWWLLLRAREIPITLVQTMRLHIEGNIIGSLTPAGIGSDVYRVAALANLEKHENVISTLMAERFIGYALFIIAAAISLPFAVRFIDADAYRALLFIIGISFALGSAVVVLLQLKWLRTYVSDHLIPTVPIAAKTKNVFLACIEFRNRIALLASLAFLTAIEIIALVILSYAAARALHIDLSFIFLLVVIPLIQVLIRLPISIQALGIQEGLYVYALIIAGFSAAEGLAVSVVLRVVDVTLILLPGALLLATRSRLPQSGSVNAQKDQEAG